MNGFNCNLNCARSCFVISMQITYPFAYFPSNSNILTFFYYFSSCFVSFHIIFVQAVFFHVILGFQEKKKTLRKRFVYNHGDSCLLRFTHTYANYPFHLADFAGDKNVAFHYPDVCLFVHPFYFDNQDFISFKLQTSFQRFNARKVMRNAVTDYNSRNTL